MASPYLVRDEQIRAIARGLREVSDAQLDFAAKVTESLSKTGRAISYEQQRRLAFPAVSRPEQEAAE